jgi:hypothetical protein
MKNFGPYCSIKHNTNLLVSSTQCNWGKVKKGAFFKFQNDEKFIEIINCKDIYYIKNFNVKNRNVLIINDECFPYISLNDIVEITYKEYELSDLGLVVSLGSGYQPGDFVYFNGGSLSPDITSPVTLKVKSINHNGGINDFDIISKGKYLNLPDSVVETTTNGNGQGFKAKPDFKEIEKRGWLDRSIIDIKNNPGQTVITLNQPIPEGVSNGKLSVKKWEINLISNYIFKEQNIISEPYTITNDIIPIINVPKLMRGHPNPDVIINLAIQKVAEILDLQSKRIEKLEKEIEFLKSNK